MKTAVHVYLSVTTKGMLHIKTLVKIQINFLHQTGSNNPLSLNKNTDKIPLHPYFTVKDILGFAITIIILTVLTLKEPYILRDPDNFTPENPLVTAVHIQPE
jgi:ubiquinol-cytochrome c reductase cytochrome b subunit